MVTGEGAQLVVADEEGLVADLEDVVGDSLRTVVPYTRDGYDPVYVRDDIAGRVSGLAAGIHEELVLQQVGTEYLEDLFRAGELQCSMHRFETLTAFHFVAGEYTGLFVSVDAESDLPLATLADTCEKYL